MVVPAFGWWMEGTTRPHWAVQVSQAQLAEGNGPSARPDGFVAKKTATPKSEGQRRGRRPKVGLTQEVKVYLTPEEKSKLDQAAALERKSMSEFLASAALRMADYKLRRERSTSKVPTT